jgi:mandelate racemase
LIHSSSDFFLRVTIMSDNGPMITDVKTAALDAPLERPIKTASGSVLSAPLILVDVRTSLDIVGRAYIFGYSKVTLRPLVELISNLKEMLIGKTISPVERMGDFDATFRLLGRQGLLGMAISGLDMALWDAFGRVHDLSVCALLGGDKRAIAAYDSYGIIDPEHDADALLNSLKKGFNGIKIKIGGGDITQDIRTVSAVREIIGDDVRLMVDYNQSLSVPDAIRRIDRLAEFDLEWVEEPVPAEDLCGHAQVREKSAVAIQTGENWWFPEDISRAIASRACDFAMLDLMKIGGITGWRRAAAQAEGASLPVSSHLFVESSAHVLAGATPSAHYLEYLDIAGAVLKQPTQITDGAVCPIGPGLGLEWDQSAIRRYAI